MIHLALTDFAAVTPGVVSPDGWKSWAATGVKSCRLSIPYPAGIKSEVRQ